MPNVTQTIEFDASVSMSSSEQRRFEAQLTQGFTRNIVGAATKAGGVLTKLAKTAGSRFRVNMGIADAAKKAASALGVNVVSRGGGKDGAKAEGGGVIARTKGAANDLLAKTINKNHRQMLLATKKASLVIAQAVAGLSSGKDDQANHVAKDTAPAPVLHTATENGKKDDQPSGTTSDPFGVKVTNPKDIKPPPPPPPSRDGRRNDPRPERKKVIELDFTKILETLMNMANRIFDITRAALEGAVIYTKEFKQGNAAFDEAVRLADELGLTTDEAAQRLNEALTSGMYATNSMYKDLTDVASVSEYLGLSIQELVTDSRKILRNNKVNFDLAQAAAGLAEKQSLTVQEAYSIVTSAASSIGKSGVSVGNMVGRVQRMVQEFGDEIGPALAQMRNIFRGQTIGDTIKEIMLMGTDNAEKVLRKARTELGEDAFSKDVKDMIDKALGSGDMIAMAEAMQLIGPAAEDLAETVRGSRLGLGFGSTGIAQMAYRQVTGKSAEEVQDLRVMGKVGVLGATPTVIEGKTRADDDVKAVKFAMQNITDVLQKSFDKTLTGDLGKGLVATKEGFQEVGKAAEFVIGSFKALGAAIAALVMGRDPVKAAKGAAKGTPLADIFTVVPLPPAKDFIFREKAGGGMLTPIHSQDQFYGAKPGGPIDRAIANINNGMSQKQQTNSAPASVNHITININGGDMGKVYDVVRNVLRQSGVRPPAGAYTG